MSSKRKVAVLIDAENITPDYADQIFEKASSLGIITSRELYGSAASISAWTEPVLKYALDPRLSIRTTKGKNTSDIALTIGAMDILAVGAANLIVIVSSDSDFSALAVRLRKSGIYVVGIGLKTVNPLWKTACSEFVALKHTEAEKREEVSPGETHMSVEAIVSDEDAVASPSQEERRNTIFKAIEKQITANNGRIPATKLFLALNRLPEYQADKQASGIKKAQQYLIAAFSDKVRIESEGANAWITLSEGKSIPPVEADHVVNEPPESESALMRLLISAEVDEETASAICSLVDDNGNLFKAYNKLRAKFGNLRGSEYYHIVRDYFKGEHSDLSGGGATNG